MLLLKISRRSLINKLTRNKHVVISIVVATADPDAVLSGQGDDVIAMEAHIEVEDHVAWLLAFLCAEVYRHSGESKNHQIKSVCLLLTASAASWLDNWSQNQRSRVPVKI